MFIEPDHPKLTYCGRIDHTKRKAPVMVYPCSSVQIRFTGDALTVCLENHRAYWDNYMGYILDGTQGKFLLDACGKQSYRIPVSNVQKVHECMLFKRMDACHHVTFYGFTLAKDGEVLDAPALPARRMEFYGDSVSAGEVSEAVDYVGKEDPLHNGEYSNSWYSYAWMTARKLHAAIHDIAQGGAALMDGTGWFAQPDAIGMESIYDKIEYHPQLGQSRPWDFSSYVPQVVVIAIGQNDSHPEDFMAAHANGEKARIWKQHYGQFVQGIRKRYPRAVIVLATTILEHHVHWDEAVDEVCRNLGDDRIYHFLYRRNGCGTPGHIRIPEAEQMAGELSAFIERLGEDIWQDTREAKTDWELDLEAGISNRGNLCRFQRVFGRAQRGEALSIAFIGGSITQGSLASRPELCYAKRVFAWWEKTFPNAAFCFRNAGIGGTTSQFGCARVYQDVLAYEPDVVIVEFSVNDESTELFLETYEGLVRSILSAPSRPAVLLVHNVRYDNGANAQMQHAKIARHYQIPGVSMQSCIYPQVVSGNIPIHEITSDNLHPNDNGHRLLSEVITYFLQKMLAQADASEVEEDDLPQPLTANCYEGAVRIQSNQNPCVLDGFYADHRPRQGLTDVFKNGWTAWQPGARIVFEVEASELAVQYRKSIQKPAPSAIAVIDGKEASAVRLDGNFEEDWGDCLYLQTLLHHGEYKKHTVAVTLLPSEPGQEPVVPFYLASLILSGRRP